MTKHADHHISVKGARVNNLKNIDVEIPRDKLIVITGLSGSGKSSLAFDTLYAEGQRRYVESLSAYARQFLGRMNKPECDYIKGIPPAIAIEQKVNTRNPRSTVGTSTEIYEYLRLLFARIGKTISPISGEEVKKHQAADVFSWLASFPEGTRFTLSVPLIIPQGRTVSDQLSILQKQGYVRVYIQDAVCRISDVLEDTAALACKDIELLIDRLTVSSDKAAQNRLADSLETAFFEGRETCYIRLSTEPETKKTFSKKFEADGILFEEPTDQMFSFNNPLGACPECEGFGKVMGIEENLVIPNKTLSVYDGAVVCWKGETMGTWLTSFIQGAAAHDFPIHRPYLQLTPAQKRLLWQGAKGLYGINDFFNFVKENLYKVQYRVLQSRYRGKTTCPTCEGSRLKKEALYVRIGGKNIQDIVSLPITEAVAFFDTLRLDEGDAIVGKRLLTEIRSRLSFLLDIGLGYLCLDRLSNTLSGGESQRINLATSLGSSLVGSLYILDEPSIGLHSRDTERLIRVLRQLQALGNTVIIVEHDQDIIEAADYIIDIGPDAGRLGGEVVFQGNVSKLPKGSSSHTVRYLTGEEQIPLPDFHRSWRNYIEVKGARKHNLKDIDVKFPLNTLTVVSGVSGSGKSTLVRDIFYEGVKRLIDDAKLSHVECSSIEGDAKLLTAIEYIDQNAIGKSSRSNPVTYIGAYDDIRKLFAAQTLSKQMGFSAGYFSFNSDGGRCDSCKGDGSITVEMQFMADISLTCETCHGKRFKKDILEVLYNGASIHDILEMTINQAILFFEQAKEASCKKIVRKLKPLQDVGLGYIKMGQSSSTLSGGENQRVKLAYYLGQEKTGATLFIFDEPTTGLHFHDIKTLLKAFDALIAKGHSLVVVEHNMDVIKCADHIIDLGPEGGKAGGHLVCCGTPEEVAACPDSHTGKYLKQLNI